MSQELATKKCPHCAEVVQKAAKVCKHCNRKMGHGFFSSLFRFIGGTFIVLFVIGFIAGLFKHDDPSPKPAEQAQASTTPEAAPPQLAKIGDTVDIDDLSYTFKKPTFKHKVGNEFTNTIAGEGATYMIIEFTVKNLSKETKTITADNFKVVTPDGNEFDSSNDATTAYVMAGNKTDWLLAQLQPGIPRKSVALFEVPQNVANSKDVQLKIKSDKLFGGSEPLIMALR